MWRQLGLAIVALVALASCSDTPESAEQANATVVPASASETTPAIPQPLSVEAAERSSAVLLQQVLVAAGFDDIVGEAPSGASGSATATASWDGERYDVTLIGPQTSNAPPVNGCSTAMFRFDSDLPSDAKQAVLRAAACDGPTQDLALTVTYEECVRTAGLTPFEAQVFVDLFGTPLFIKTAPEVPPGIHGPCWESVGGAATGLSSYGRPAPTPTPS